MRNTANTLLGSTLEDILHELEALSVSGLREHFLATLGYASKSRNRTFLIRKILWGMQVKVSEDISLNARKRAEKLADERDVITRLPKVPVKRVTAKKSTFRFSPSKDSRLPVPGSVLVRQYKGRDIRVTVGADDFEFEGKRYTSLSSIAREVTGGSYNGFLFFKLK